MTFDKYLQNIHAGQYHGTDDDMPDDFEAWLERLDKGEIMAIAERAVDEKSSSLVRAMKIAEEAIDELKMIRKMVVN